MDMGFSCRTDAFFPGVHKISAAISGPRIADTNFTDTRIFLKQGPKRRNYAQFLARGDRPNSRKKAPRMEGQMKKKSSAGFPSIPGIALGVAPRIVVFVLLKSWDAIPRMEFRIPRMEFRIPRVAPRIPRNAPRAPRMAFSLRERFS